MSTFVAQIYWKNIISHVLEYHTFFKKLPVWACLKKFSQSSGRTLMFLCLCWITDHGFKVSPRKSPESPSSERSLVFSVTAPSPQSSPSSGRLTPTNLGAGAINYSSHSINLSPYSSPGVSTSSCLMTQLCCLLKKEVYYYLTHLVVFHPKSTENE